MLLPLSLPLHVAASRQLRPGWQNVPCCQWRSLLEPRPPSLLLPLITVACLQAVETWMADRAVLPVENSLGGSIHRTYDLLLRHRLHIVGECQLPVHHCLMALPGTKLGELTRVMSHPQVTAREGSS